MIFTDLPVGEAVFIDANTFIYHFAPDPGYCFVCRDLLERVLRKEILGFTSTPVLGEVAHRLMTLEACALFSWPYAGIAQRLRKHPTQVQQLVQFRRAIQEVPQYRVHVLTIAERLIDAAAAISQQTGLLHNDALIVAVMHANGLTHLASNDADFDRVPGISRYAPL